MRYLDYNAGAPLSPAADRAMRAALDEGVANPSSIHAAGRAARKHVETARARVAALAETTPESVVFCSGGTEAIALGVIGLAREARTKEPARRRVLVGASEHPAVHGAADALAAEGFSVERVTVDEAGRVREQSIAWGRDVALVAVQAANHETGVVQPVAELAAGARDAGAMFFCDAVQAAGKLPIGVLGGLGASALAISSHKLGGPAGAGALVLGEGVEPVPLVAGHQERGRRAGTEPVIAIVGFGAAADRTRNERSFDVAPLRARLETGLVALGAHVFGADHARVPNTTACAFDGADGQLLVMALDLAGFAISTGAACTSGSVKPSAVLLAAGHPLAVARRAIRISLGPTNDAADIDALLAALPPILARVRGG